jgi:3D (Asp-Asp-Asp) domain-containing protein
MNGRKLALALTVVLLCSMLLAAGCAHVERPMEATAYCGCKKCCGWTRGSWKYLKLNFWNRYYASGPAAGRPYHGKTASGATPRQYYPGLFSVDSLARPWVIPFRIVFFPWLLLPHPGTIAADTGYYPFGTIMLIPGYGKGIVEDRGSAIQGPDRIDLFYDSHDDALAWGRRRVPVSIKKK